MHRFKSDVQLVTGIMKNSSENVLTEFEGDKEVYASFWQRALAIIIDGLVLSPTILIDWYNKDSWKSPFVLIAFVIISLLYKPLMEFKYGATVGKMAMKLLVVNKDFNKPGLMNVLLRNIFDIGHRIVILISTLLVFNMQEFQSTTTIAEFGKLHNSVINISLLTFVPLGIMVVEIILLVTDKRRRALHDRIGETLVIRR